jgi:hypothetical protein
MKLLEARKNDSVEQLYYSVTCFVQNLFKHLFPYYRRFIRFIALPYIFMVNIRSNNNNVSNAKTIYNLLYVFFKYKYFPDNYYLCRFWEQEQDEWPYYYGSTYDPYQRRQFQASIYNKKNNVLFDNKLICYQLCSVAGFPLPVQFGMLLPSDDYRSNISDIFNSSGLDKIIIKPYDGQGGKGIVVCYKNDGKIYIKRKSDTCTLDEFELDYPAVLQEYVKQHAFTEDYSSSTNTIRVVTLYTNDNAVIVVGAFMRFGLGLSDVDNLSSGGIAVGVDVASGELYERAIGFDGTTYTSHPSSGKLFKGFVIPFWKEVLRLSESVQKNFNFHKMLGLDVCVTENGPLIIEINSDSDMVALEMTYGPILKRKEVWDEFNKYDLLINQPSKCLYS